MNRNNKSQSSANQSGLASIIVTLILMIVITLIVLASAQLSRRSSRQTLDSQLNTQAYYAAESGVNDAVNAINADLASNTAITRSIDDCNAYISAKSLSNILESTNNVAYTCLFINPHLTDWQGNVDDENSKIINIESNGGAIDKITISWQAENNNSDFTSCSSAEDFAPHGTRGCKTPVLRYELVNVSAYDRNNLNNNRMVGFLKPDNGGSTDRDWSASIIGHKDSVSCAVGNSPKMCNFTINDVGGSKFYLRLKSIYSSSTVVVTPYDSSNDPVEIKNSQILIDSTGRANDVLRRIQVRVPYPGIKDFAEFALQSHDTICKKIFIEPGVPNTAANELAVEGDSANCPF